jgi:soluble lytic murein transglycosylase
LRPRMFFRLALICVLSLLFLAAAAPAREFPLEGFPAQGPAEQGFRRALGMEEAGDPGAVEAYREILGEKFPAPDAVHAALGRLLPPDQAEPHWEAVLAARPKSPFAPEALEGLARIREAQNRPAEAQELWMRLAAAAEDERGSARALLRVMNLMDRRGEAQQALDVAERIWVELACVPEAREAEAYLARSSGDPFRPVSGRRIYERGRVLLEKGRREEAVRTLARLRTRLVPGSEIGPDVDLALGRALLYLRRYEEALEPLGRAQSSPRTAEDARFYRARSLFGLDRGDEGASDLVELAREHPKSRKAPLYLYQASRVFEARKMWAEAAQAKELLLKEYPESDEADEARWNEGWRAFREGRPSEAAAIFRAGTDGASRGWTRARGLYWEARALGAAGRAEEATGQLRALVAQFPLGYYSRLARETLASGQGPDRLLDPRQTSPRRLPVFLPEAANLSFAAEAGRPWMYLTLGLPMAARRVLRESGRSGLSWARLAYWAEDFSGAIRASGRSWLDWPGAGDPKPLDLEGLAFPIAYPVSASRAAEQAGIHPHLLLAVAHTESHFDPEAFSPWEARGLMQFIPSTGAAVARAAGIEGFEPEDLYDPGVALRLGARHLRELLDRFGGDTVAAVAAYNAGAAAVEGWRERCGSVDWDVFVESIPYRETRQYVKKVLTALDAYSRLDPPGLWGSEAR